VQNPYSLPILGFRVWVRKHRRLQKCAQEKKQTEFVANSAKFYQKIPFANTPATKLSLSHHPLFFAQIPRFVVVDAILLAGVTASGAEAAAGF
jgi:hypothetical protein